MAVESHNFTVACRAARLARAVNVELEHEAESIRLQHCISGYENGR